MPSSPAEARRSPSGLNATVSTMSVVAFEWLADWLAAVGVPQPHRVVVARRGETFPVRTEHHTVHRAFVAMSMILSVFARCATAV